MSLFSKFFKKEESSVLGIDIGSSAIKVVQVKKKNGQAVLETYGEYSLGPYGGGSIGQAVNLSAEKIAQALVALMKETEVNVTTVKCGISIPFGSSLMSVIEIPQVNMKQLKLVVPIEARKYIPVPISEVQLDWSVIPKSDDKLVQEELKPGEPATALVPKVNVLVVAIHNETISRYQSIVTSSGLDAKFYEIEIFSTMRAVLEQTLQPVMIMDMGAASTKLYVVERGIIKASHNVNRGSQDISATMSKSLGIPIPKAEVMKREVGLLGPDRAVTEIITLSLDYIFTEANLALLSFEKKYNKAVAKVVLVGGGATLKGLAPLAKENFRTEAVMADPFSKLSTPAFLDKILKETGPEFAVAIGIALRRLAEEE